MTMFSAFLKAADGIKYPEALTTLSDLPVSAIVAYVVFLNAAACVYEYVAEQSYSSVLTLSAIVQCLGMTLVCIQVASKGGEGISARSLILDALSLGLRLSSTLVYQGYLPADRTGDGIYQFFDLCTLFLSFFALYYLLVKQRHTYDELSDSMRVGPMVLGCFILAALLHGDMNSRVIPDTMWMAGLFVGVVAVLPKYWLITKSGSRAQPLIAHYIMSMGIGRILSGLFIWHVREHITCIPWFGEFQHAVYAIGLAHIIHMLLLSDFACFYVRSCVLKFKGSSRGDICVEKSGVFI